MSALPLLGAPGNLVPEAAHADDWVERLREVDPRFWVLAAVVLLAFAGFFQKALRFVARFALLVLALGGVYLAYVVWRHSEGSFEQGLEFLHDLGAGGDAADQREAFSRAGEALDLLLEEARGEGAASYRQLLDEAAGLLEDRIG
ncbi:MAG TPA: hypothetical protein VMN36_07515, partial [Verrucomicrobiales bacterium]|nr:hypothetical protein [Verrucomicrobiales bacterium]